jgi:hypothetical protein
MVLLKWKPGPRGEPVGPGDSGRVRRGMKKEF